MNFNITNIAQYVGWGFLAIFLAIALFIGINLYLEYSKEKKTKEVTADGKPLSKEEKSKFKSVGTKRALRIDDKDKKSISKDTLAKNVFSQQESKKPVGFAPKAGSSNVESISAGLSELNGATTLNPFRTPVDEEDAFLQQNSVQPDVETEPNPYDYGTEYNEPAPVAPTAPVKNSAPSIPGPPPVVSGSAKPSGFVNKEQTEKDSAPKNPAIRRPLPPPPSSLK